ncbi:hypothetical protein GCK72_020128 [Caenorhabditis remanei]|uniref:Uncharacterized protein n=1 Tax=Caenorhabditis remanei TaxID=31234 RepID=A0A6A5GG65_CAERE|nr:hypothetical protein GCK72_020128 [Caenorhabditis remanei]KAF1753571.1 hypothetical protein GCK72_020128 [Caenorhabditis remanei]
MMAKNLLTVFLVLFDVFGQLSSELNKLSYSENEERVNKCGTEIIFEGKPLNNPWMSEIDKNPGVRDLSLGLLISPRHAIFSSFLVFDKVWPFREYNRFEAEECKNRTPTAVTGSKARALEMGEFGSPIKNIHFFGDCSIESGFLIYEIEKVSEPPPICLEGIDDDPLDVLLNPENSTIEADVFLDSLYVLGISAERIPGYVFECNYYDFTDVCWSPMDRNGTDVILKYQKDATFPFQSSLPLIKTGKRPSLIGFIRGIAKDDHYVSVYTFRMHEMDLCSIIGTCKSVPTTPTTTTTTTRIITTTPVPPSTSPPPTTTSYEVAMQEDEDFEIPYDRKNIKKGIPDEAVEEAHLLQVLWQLTFTKSWVRESVQIERSLAQSRIASTHPPWLQNPHEDGQSTAMMVLQKFKLSLTAVPLYVVQLSSPEIAALACGARRARRTEMRAIIS